MRIAFATNSFASGCRDRTFVSSMTCIQQEMTTKPKAGIEAEEKTGLGVDEQPADEIVNDSLGTIDAADTADTEPNDDPEIGGKGSGRKEEAA